MIGLAGATLRSRWLTVAGAFVALALGVGMIATVALVFGATFSAPPRPPQRFAASPAVIVGPAELTVRNGQDRESARWSERPSVVPDLVDRLAAAGRTVTDRVFYAQAPDGPAGQVGHPWSAAQLAPYRLVAGRAPMAGDEVVLPTGGAATGGPVTIRTSAGPRTYTVVGLVAQVDFESALFFSDAEAARLSPAADAVAYRPGTSPDLNELRRVTGDAGQVLTGDARRAAEGDRDHHQLVNTRTLLGVAGGLAAFVAVFVVASTFAFTVAQRRADFALLRTVGATPRQVRRLVLGEAALVGLAGSLAGCLAGVVAGPLLGGRLARDGTAPAWFHTGPAVLPLLLSVAVGVGVAVLAAWTAARRAGRVAPVEALQQAVVDRVALTRGRLVTGLVLLGCALGGMAFISRAQPRIATVPVIYLWLLILTVTAVAVLAPALVPPLVRLVTWPLTWQRGAGGMLVRQNALAAVGRTAGTAAPVLLVVGLALSLLGALAATDRARLVERERALSADLVLLPDGAPGISPALGARLAATGDVDVATPVPLTVYGMDSGRLRDYDATAVDPHALARTAPPRLLSGSLAALTEGTVVVSKDLAAGVGQTMPLWLADGHRLDLRVVGVTASTITGPDLYLAPAYVRAGGGSGLAESVLVALHPGADAAAVRARATRLAGGFGARVASRSDYAHAGSGTPQSSTTGVLFMLAITALYCGIAIVNTMMMAASARIREFAVLRLAGATPRQVSRVVAGEALLVVAVGVVLAALATAVNLLGTAAALGRLVGGLPLAFPWPAGAVLVAGSVVLVLAGSLLTVRVTMRAPAVQLVGARE